LPAEYHTIPGFEAARAQLHAGIADSASRLAAVLGIGLGLRDIMIQQEIEPGTPPIGVPEWLLNSELSVAQISPLLDYPKQGKGKGKGKGKSAIPGEPRTLRKRKQPQDPDVEYGCTEFILVDTYLDKRYPGLVMARSQRSRKSLTHPQQVLGKVKCVSTTKH
jgi:hypothetical protein